MNSRATLLWLAITAMAWWAIGCAGDGRDHDAPTRDHGHSHNHDHDHDHDHSHADGHDHVHAVGVGSSHPEFVPTAPCTCVKDIYHNTWCRHCNIGHVAGKSVSSAMLFSTIDAHGHDLDLTTITCETCRENISAGGFCEPCSTGFYNKQAYFTKLTWGIAQGAAINPRDLQCATCVQSFGKTGWCDACGQGFVGNVAIADRDIYDATAPEHAVFLAAIDKTDECEECACAMVMHRTCPKCQINYATSASLSN